MATRHSIRKSLTGAYCVTEDFLKDMQLRFEKTFGSPPRFRIKFKNDHESIYDDASDVLSDSEVRSERIDSLSISSDTWGEDLRAELNFSSGILSPSVYLNVSGDRDRCIIFERAMLSELRSIRSSFSFLYVGERAEGLIIGVSAGLMTFLFLILGGYEITVGSSVLTFFSVSFLLSLLRAFVSPKFEFDFGRGRSAISLRKKIIYFFFGTVFVGGIIAIYQAKVVEISDRFFEENTTDPSAQKPD